MSEALNELSSHICEMWPDLVVLSQIEYGELSLTTDAANIVQFLTLLRDDVQCGFVCIIDICGVDWPAREKRFDVVYHLLSPRQNLRIRVKCAVGEDDLVASACAVYAGADWFEREIWDMYGFLLDRTSVVSGKRVSVSVGMGGRR